MGGERKPQQQALGPSGHVWVLVVRVTSADPLSDEDTPVHRSPKRDEIFTASVGFRGKYAAFEPVSDPFTE